MQARLINTRDWIDLYHLLCKMTLVCEARVLPWQKLDVFLRLFLHRQSLREIPARAQPNSPSHYQMVQTILV